MNFRYIADLCEQRRISIPELAEKIGISKPGLYRSIQNKSMKIDTLEKIAKALDTPVYYFFLNEDNPAGEASRIPDFLREDVDKEIENAIEITNKLLVDKIKYFSDRINILNLRLFTYLDFRKLAKRSLTNPRSTERNAEVSDMVQSLSNFIGLLELIDDKKLIEGRNDDNKRLIANRKVKSDNEELTDEELINKLHAYITLFQRLMDNLYDNNTGK